ncbi:MAG: DUF1049 domain-containing protein [Hormoscilla sp. SP12CHS1]|nr:DUF1049 domain-containing protein [Hormoscilla sp. SP12CHS1]
MEKMKIIPPVLIAIFLALWVSAIAILSVQNATAISLKFIVFQSIRVPVGVMLGFTVGVGVIGGAIAQPLSLILRETNETEYPDYEYD